MFGKLFERRKPLVIIAGVSKFGARIAGLMSEQNCDVVVIDKDKNAFCKLPDNFSGLTVEGDASDTSVLDTADITKASVCIAATESDTMNSLIAQVAGRVYNIPNVYVRLNDTANNSVLVRSNIHIICPADLCLSEFKRQSGLASGESAT